MMITIWQIAPSLRMGNTVVVKPPSSPRCPSWRWSTSSTRFCRGVLRRLRRTRGGCGPGRTPGFDKIMFTGSTATGQAIIEASADNSPGSLWSSAATTPASCCPTRIRRRSRRTCSGARSSTPARPAPRSSGSTCTTPSTTRSARRSSTSRACRWALDSTSRTCSARCRTGSNSTSSRGSSNGPRPGAGSWSAATPTRTARQLLPDDDRRRHRRRRPARGRGAVRAGAAGHPVQTVDDASPSPTLSTSASARRCGRATGQPARSQPDRPARLDQLARRRAPADPLRRREEVRLRARIRSRRAEAVAEPQVVNG